MNLYEGMFLIDNDLVRADWPRAKALVRGALEKHGAVVRTLRRWDERALAYTIRGRRRATYFLAYFETDGQSQPAIVRDLDLDESVLRYLLVRVEAVPDGELELSAAELAEGFAPPPPPEEVVVEEEEPEPEPPRRSRRGAEEEPAEDAEEPAEGVAVGARGAADEEGDDQ